MGMNRTDGEESQLGVRVVFIDSKSEGHKLPDEDNDGGMCGVKDAVRDWGT